MRQGQQNRRGRGRGNNSHNQNHGGNHNNRKPQNLLSKNYESNGPDVKIRGTAQHIAEKYMHLARDASSAGDFIMAENYLQHAEHYNRIIMAAQAANAQFHAQPSTMGHQSGADGMNGHGHAHLFANGAEQTGDGFEPASDARSRTFNSPAETREGAPEADPQTESQPVAAARDEQTGGRHRRRRRPSGGAEGRRPTEEGNGHAKGHAAFGEDSAPLHDGRRAPDDLPN